MKTVHFERKAEVGEIILANPPTNRLGRQFADDLTVAVHAASQSGIRALMVRAEGPNFGTGGDVSEWPGKDIHWFHTFISEVNQAYKAIEALRVPSVVAVKGQVVGGHYELALHGDLIVAAEDATFTAVEAHTGMAQLAGGAQRLADRIGRNRATQLMLLAEPITGTEAGRIGLACRVVPAAQVDEVAMEIATSLAKGPTLAFGAMRALLKAWSSGGVPAADELLLDLTIKLFDSDDAQQAFRSLKAAVEAGGDKAQTEATTKLVFSGR